MISLQDLRILEDNSEEHGVSKSQLMENAGKAFVRELKKHYSVKGKKILIACHHGNNGGDGFVIARLLAGSDVTVLFTGDQRKMSPEARENFEKLPARVKLVTKTKDLGKYQLAIDALLGTGGEGNLKGEIKKAVDIINAQKKIVSVDVPTGVDPASGKKSKPSVRADLTITFHDKKPGLEGLRVVVVPIGIPAEADEFIGKGEVIAALPNRPNAAHKGEYGKVLIVGGSEDFSGAPTLAVMALASLRGGVDLVKIVAPSRVAWAINSFTPDVITKKLPGERITPDHVPLIEKEIKWADVVVFGPGLGRHEETEEAMGYLLQTDKPKVVDADALKMTNFSTLTNAILTPHKAEFAQLWANTFGRMANLERGTLSGPQMKKLQGSLGSNIVLLKGAEDVVVSSERVKRNLTGDPGMAVGGTGDVLAGLTAGILAQTGEPFLSACAAAYLSGKAGESCRNEMRYSYIASDIVHKIPFMIRRLFDA